jgi:SAM-dependent methyltransferase
MSLDYKYIVWESKKLSSKGRILDFGCGGGSVVRYGIEQGLDIVGADIFYEGNDSRREAEQSGLLGESLFEIKNGKLPFDDDEFDLIVSNQVFEHIREVDQSLTEISRVLKPSGMILLKFPVYDTFREDHCGIPFAHRVPDFMRLKFIYMFLMRAFGLGHNKKERRIVDWVKDYLVYFKKFLHYRKISFYRRKFDGFNFHFERVDNSYVAYRISQKFFSLRDSIVHNVIFKMLSESLMKRFGSVVYLLRFKK